MVFDMARGTLSAAAVLSLTLAFAASAGATHSAGQGGPDDFIVGNVKTVHAVLGEAQLTVAAHSGSAGESPRGRVRVRLSGLIGSIDATGTVQCLSTNRRVGNGFAELDEPLPDGSRYLLFDVIDEPIDPADPKSPRSLLLALLGDAPRTAVRPVRHQRIWDAPVARREISSFTTRLRSALSSSHC